MQRSQNIMGKITGFKEFKRKAEPYRNISIRLGDYDEIFTNIHDIEHLQEQGARCMDCGVPFCQSNDGCPVDNLIPEWNDLVYHNKWQEALERLHKTNNFPEFTGRVCPAPCEGSCVLGISEPAVTIKNIEAAIIDKGFQEGWVTSNNPKFSTGKKIAIIGSGPAGLSAADELNKKGHNVVVFERDDRIGGLLMYGIPNMKLDKNIVNRRVKLLKKSGIEFVVNADIGNDIAFEDIRSDFDAILLATGATKARKLELENSNVNGIHLAMDYLTTSTKYLLSNKKTKLELSAKNKRVIVIGGGDTGCDCIATALRQGARSIVNFELMPQPPEHRAKDNPWPQWPLIYRIEYGHAEVVTVYGSDPRKHCVKTKKIIVKKGKLVAIETVRVDANDNFKELENSTKMWQTDLVLLAMGFVSPEHYLSSNIGIRLDVNRNYRAEYGEYNTNKNGIFTAGDCRRGQSLVVWAINEGRGAAKKIHDYLQDSD